MSDLPEPFSKPECDLRGYDFMPLFGHRLFRSELYDLSSAEEFRAAVKLWWEAWNQCPAGSLPNDDRNLAKLTDFGRDVKGWLKIKEGALRGFVLCRDGRLYHRWLCEWAMEAYGRRVKERDKKRAWREKTGGGRDGPVHRDNDECPPGQDGGQRRMSPGDGTVSSPMRGEERRGQERIGKEKKEKFKIPLKEESLREPLPADGPGLAQADAVFASVGRSLRHIEYAPGRSVPSVEDQLKALGVGSKPPPRAMYLTPEQLALARSLAKAGGGI